jgi:enoyl-CoA hydratase/carnithine racemase
MGYEQILVESQGPIGILTLNSPKTVNALSRTMIAEIISALNSFSEDVNLKTIIIKANGKHFCSGHNLSEMVGGSRGEYKFIFDQCTRMMLLIQEIPQIVIAQVHGVATAGGCQLVASCDLAVADETSRFATPGVKIGLFCTTPMVALSRNIGRKRSMEMLMTGKMISAQEAEHYGLINRVVPAQDLEATVMEMALSISEASPLVLATGKRAFYHQIEMDKVRAYEYASNVITLNLLADDAQAGINAFLQKTKPTWTGK